MSGALWSIVAGLTLGMFQLSHRRAGQALDVRRGNFILLLACLLVLMAASLLTEDLSKLFRAPIGAHLNFAVAGFIHFVLGWTLLSVSQKKIGAARTGSLIGVTPLFAAGLAALTLGEVISLQGLMGILLVVIGVYFVSNG